MIGTRTLRGILVATVTMAVIGCGSDEGPDEPLPREVSPQQVKQQEDWQKKVDDAEHEQERLGYRANPGDASLIRAEIEERERERLGQRDNPLDEAQSKVDTEEREYQRRMEAERNSPAVK